MTDREQFEAWWKTTGRALCGCSLVPDHTSPNQVFAARGFGAGFAAGFEAARAQPAQAGQVLTDDQWQRIADITQSILTRDIRDEIEAVLATRVPQWLPIEAAPKDEAVLGYWSDGYYERVVMSDDGECEVYHILHDGEQRADNPSHWMPLPPPPGIVGEKGGA